MMRAKIDLMKMKQDLLLRLGKETNATVQATNKAVQHLNRKHDAARQKLAVLKENEIDDSDVTVTSRRSMTRCKRAGRFATPTSIPTYTTHNYLINLCLCNNVYVSEHV
jgi:hypothetical protein